MSQELVGGTERYSERSELLIRIDHEICAGFGDCVDAAPDVFALNEDGLAIVLDPDSVDADVLIAAAESCPVSAILLFDGHGAQVAPQL